MGNTRISYLTDLWSPTSGCSPCGPACDHCWAMNWHKRFRGGDFGVKLHPDRLYVPTRWRKPRVVGVSFLGDLFHEQVPDRFLASVFLFLSSAQNHQHLLLTKRPERMREVFSDPEWVWNHIEDHRFDHIRRRVRFPYDCLWHGVSAWDQPSWDANTALLREIPAVHRWVSLEPLLGPVDVGDLRGIDWVTAGCESGAQRRPAPWEWFQDLAKQCADGKTRYYEKQRAIFSDGTGEVVKYSPTPLNLPWTLRKKGR